jgi:hypothetical protein
VSLYIYFCYVRPHERQSTGILGDRPNIAVLLTAVAVIAGIIGYELGRHEPTQQPVINVYPPGTNP